MLPMVSLSSSGYFWKAISEFIAAISAMAIT
jgi:hypothetical protein